MMQARWAAAGGCVAGGCWQGMRSVPRQTRKLYSSQEKIRIVLEGLRGEYSIADLCRREGIAQGL